jgi:hypothetical protein
MKNRLIFCAVISLAALCTSAPSRAADAFPSPNFECWIGQREPISINCIQYPSLYDLGRLENPDDKMEAALLNFIHKMIISRHTAGLDEFVDMHSGQLRAGALQVIPIWKYPAESSWKEGLPATLVKAALCPSDMPCTVILNRPAR